MQLFNRRGSNISKIVMPLVLSLLSISYFSQISLAETTEKHKPLLGKKEKMAADPIVELETSKGTIKIQIFKNEAPITSDNFLDLVNRGFYNGLSFHRYEPGFVIQGGDPKGNGTGGFIDPETKKERRIQLEIKPDLKHDEAGMVAMARSNEPNSASSQFYITLAPASFLNGNYAVFGKVVDGLNIALNLRAGDKMTKVQVLEPATK